MRTDIDECLEALRGAFQDFREQLEAEAQAALRGGNFGATRAAVDRVERMAEVVGALADVEERWRAVANGEAAPRRRRRTASTTGGEQQAPPPRRPHGLLTPHAAYCRPTLQALIDLGGTAPKQRACDRVGELMAGLLNEHDREPLASSGEPTWRNRTAWVRHCLVRAGLLSENSRTGIWEITDAGRRWLREGREIPSTVPGARKYNRTMQAG